MQLQSGVYWLNRGGLWREKARGLGRVVGEGMTEDDRRNSLNEKILARINTIENAWASRTRRVYFPVKLFVTSRKACTGDNWFPRWGHWYEMHDEETGERGRGLELLCTGWGKRRLKQRIPHGELVDTEPTENIGWTGEGDLGEIYQIPWIDGDAIYDEEEDYADD